jgi:hypothetical protein
MGRILSWAIAAGMGEPGDGAGAIEGSARRMITLYIRIGDWISDRDLMTMRRTLLALALIAATTPAALACTEDELQAKSIELADLVKAIVAKDPAQQPTWRAKQVDVDRLAERSTDINQICAAYDAAITEAKAAQ